MTPVQNYLQVQLALLQHHLDDARIYSGTGHQDATGLSLDDAEESLERVGDKSLPPEAQKQIKQVADDGDHEAEKAGVPATKHEKDEKIACFQLGMDVLCRQLGMVGPRRELFRKVASQIALERVKTAAEVLECIGEFGSAPRPKGVKRAGSPPAARQSQDQQEGYQQGPAAPPSAAPRPVEAAQEAPLPAAPQPAAPPDPHANQRAAIAQLNSVQRNPTPASEWDPGLGTPRLDAAQAQAKRERLSAAQARGSQDGGGSWEDHANKIRADMAREDAAAAKAPAAPARPATSWADTRRWLDQSEEAQRGSNVARPDLDEEYRAALAKANAPTPQVAVPGQGNDQPLTPRPDPLPLQSKPEPPAAWPTIPSASGPISTPVQVPNQQTQQQAIQADALNQTQPVQQYRPDGRPYFTPEQRRRQAQIARMPSAPLEAPQQAPQMRASQPSYLSWPNQQFMGNVNPQWRAPQPAKRPSPSVGQAPKPAQAPSFGQLNAPEGAESTDSTMAQASPLKPKPGSPQV